MHSHTRACMRMCVCVCLNECMCISMYTSCVYTHQNKFANAYEGIEVSAYYIYTYIYIYMDLGVCACVWVYMHVSGCVCMYLSIISFWVFSVFNVDYNCKNCMHLVDMCVSIRMYLGIYVTLMITKCVCAYVRMCVYIYTHACYMLAMRVRKVFLVSAYVRSWCKLHAIHLTIVAGGGEGTEDDVTCTAPMFWPASLITKNSNQDYFFTKHTQIFWHVVCKDG